MHDFIAQLIQFHREKASAMTNIRKLLPSVEKLDQSAQIELGAQFEAFRSDAERAHHHNEELILRELQRDHAPVHPRIERTAEEHEAFGHLVSRLCKQIEELSDEPKILIAGVEWFLTQYDDHASNEEAILFPAANSQLSPEAWSRIGESWNQLSH